MAKAREIKKRIKAVSNTRKITKTMEMVATARARQLQMRVHDLRPYTAKLQLVSQEIAANAGDDTEEVLHPLLAEPSGEGRIEVVIITANRGLCGAYNSRILQRSMKLLQELEAAGEQVVLHVVGKKGLRFFRHRRVPIDHAYGDFDYLPDFQKVRVMADGFMQRIIDHATKQVLIVYGHYVSAGEQRPDVAQLLPLTGFEEGAGEAPELQLDFHPDPFAVLDAILPLDVRMRLYSKFLESSTSEQIARRVAMKNSTDNADDMIGVLRRWYNRARQSQITSEIADIVGGASALT